MSETTDDASGEPTFDADTHRARAIDEYKDVVDLFADYAQVVRSILRECLERNEVRIHSIEARGKDIESFGRKASQVSESDPRNPKYPTPVRDITDLAGVRVITFFLDTLQGVDGIIQEELDVLEVTDKSEVLAAEEKLGYQSIHYLVRLADNRSALPEYARFDGLVAEVQVRTILQHAWAEIEHDVEYKAIDTVPASVRRRFISLAGVIEVADREFQSIDDDNRRLQEEAAESVQEGRLTGVEITPGAVKAYLDSSLGPDGRMSPFSYQFLTRILRNLGFSTIEEVDSCVQEFDDDRISRILHGSRMGQTTRFEGMLLAAVGEEYIRRHPFGRTGLDWWVEWNAAKLARLKDSGIETGHCVPGEE